MSYGGDPRVYRQHWATLQDKSPREIYTPLGLRQSLTQCEGCSGPLEDYLADGYVMRDFNITWVPCLDHAGYGESPYGSNLPYDTDDEYRIWF